MKPKRKSTLPGLTMADMAGMLWLDNLITMTGALASVPAAYLAVLPRHVLQRWAHQNSVYVFPTDELVAWLRAEIGTDSAIEIGAGNGGIATALGIPATDSWVQVDDPEIRAQFAVAQHPVSHPGSHVHKLDALAAIDRYKPHTVIGAYVTHKWRPGEELGFVYGVEEEEVLRRVKQYIVIGNDGPHACKRIMKRPHRTIRAPWLITRAIDPTANAIYVWEGRCER